MNAADIVLLALLAAATAWGVVRCVKNARRGGACGGCTGCADGKGCSRRNE